MENKDSFQNKISEIRHALDYELYNCALAVALTLPDICGKAEYPEEKNINQRYKNWFNKYAISYFTSKATALHLREIVDYTWMSAEECWQLRCAVLHAGDYNVEKIDLSNVSIHAHKRDGCNYYHQIRDAKYADWDVIQICENLCAAAEQYYLNIEDKAKLTINEVRIDVW